MSTPESTENTVVGHRLVAAVDNGVEALSLHVLLSNVDVAEVVHRKIPKVTEENAVHCGLLVAGSLHIEILLEALYCDAVDSAYDKSHRRSKIIH